MPHDLIHSVDGSHLDSPKTPQDAVYKGHILSVNLGKLSKNDKSLQGPFLGHILEHFQRQDTPILTNTAKQEQYLINDFMAVGRSAAALSGANPDVQDIMGETGVTLVATGAHTWNKGKEEEKAALRALDVQAEKRAKDTQLLGKTESMMGLTIGASRSEQLGTNTSNVNCGITATTSLGQATFSLGAIAGFFSSVWYGMVGLEAWHSLKKISALEKEMKGKSRDETITFLKAKLDFSPEETLKFLEEKYNAEVALNNEKVSEKTPLVIKEFKEWLEEILSKETEALAKDFLQTINPDDSKEYDWDQAAKEMTNSLSDVAVIRDGDIKDKGLTTKALIGLESLHRNRLEMAKLDLTRCIGTEAVQEILDFPGEEGSNSVEIEAKKQELMKKIEKGLAEAKTTNSVLLAFGVFGLAIVVASTIGACIVCPPVGLIIACIVCTIILNVVVAGVDWNSLIKAWDDPIGKYEERSNTIKLLVGVGSILGICLLSAGTYGAPAIVGLTFIASSLITSFIRYGHAWHKRATDKEIDCSMQNLLEKLKKCETLGPADVNLVETKRKIKIVLERKLQRTHKLVKEGFSSEKIITYLDENNIIDLKKEIESWKLAEDLIIRELKEAFATLTKGAPVAKSWMSSFKEMFVDAPQLRRIFPDDPPPATESTA